MDSLKIDLKEQVFFRDEEIDFKSKINFVYGKNGTGKSTITRLLVEQVMNYDVHAFQGFEGIVGEEQKLEAIVLGEENNAIDRQIKEIEKNIFDKKTEIEELNKDIENNNEYGNNLYSDYNKAHMDYKSLDNTIDKFYIDSASQIKNFDNPQIVKPNYNKNNFKNDLKQANTLSNEEYENNINIIKSVEKNANPINYKDFKTSDLIEKTKTLLSQSVKEKEVITEIENDPRRRAFVEEGLKLHEQGEHCSFCGNKIDENRYKKIERYFSVDEVQALKEDINNYILELDNYIKSIENIDLNVENYYSNYQDKVKQLSFQLKNMQNENIKFLDKLKQLTERKKKNLFGPVEFPTINIPPMLSEVIDAINEITHNNNKEILNEMKEDAKNKILYHKIKEKLKEFNFNDKSEELKEKSLKCKELETKYKEKEDVVTRLKKEISDYNKEIKKLLNQTKNEEILANKINEKLSVYVNFTLEYENIEGNKGHYHIRCNNTKEIRKITHLSTGEKNIIAFLYFLEKINELDTPKNNLDKLIIFDDPMSSNDDTMQYLIIEELDKLLKSIGDRDKVVILTHNTHFYINVRYGYPSYKKNNFIHLISDKRETTIRIIESKDKDFQTSYEALWNELHYLYDMAPKNSMLLNPIRRIIETYTKFNGMSMHDMLSKVSGAQKYFNVNSHGIDDLEADLNGQNKEDIIEILKKCFKENHAESHFKKYWTDK